MKSKSFAGVATAFLFVLVAGFSINVSLVSGADSPYTITLYGADWCGPCRDLKAEYAGLINSGQVKIFNVDTIGKNGVRLPDGSTFKKGGPLPYSERVSEGKVVPNSGKQGKLPVGDELKGLQKAQQISQDECIFMAPGAVDHTFTPADGVSGEGFTIMGSATGYGDYKPAIMLFSPLNQKLFPLYGLFSTKFERLVAGAKKDQSENAGKKVTIYLPNGAQADEFMRTGKYTVGDGIKVTGGSHFRVGQLGADGLTANENCKLEKKPAPTPPNGSNLGSWGQQGGNGGGFGGNGGGGLGGGLGSLLPLLMSGMLGGGQQNGQNQNGYNNGYGAGYGNNQQTGCAQYGTSPVCGTDNRTYTNQCWMQQLGVTMKSYGVCAVVVPTPAPAPTPNVSVLMNQLAASGVPSSLIDTLRNTVASILGSVVGGGNSSEVVIR